MNGEKFKTKASAWVAAAARGMPARRMQVIVVAGPDGADTTVAYLASMLKAAGVKIGVIARDAIEIAGERVTGSDQAHPLDEVRKLHDLLAHMRKARCQYVIIEQPPYMPPHEFTGVPIAMLVVRRCGDSYLNQPAVAARVAHVQALLRQHPRLVVLPRDDACFEILQQPGKATIMTYGTHAQAECRITNVQLHPKGSAATLLVDHQTEVDIMTGLAGRQTIYSVAAAATAAYMLHMPVSSLEDGAADVPLLPAHCEYLPLDRPYHLVLDRSYTPEGMIETLETLKHFAKNRLIVVIGATIEQAQSWLPTIGEIVCKQADRIIVTDGEYSQAQDASEVRDRLLSGISMQGGEAKTEPIADRKLAIEKALSIARRGDTIVLCPSLVKPYRQLGGDRLHWSDRATIRELLEG